MYRCALQCTQNSIHLVCLFVCLFDCLFFCLFFCLIFPQRELAKLPQGDIINTNLETTNLSHTVCMGKTKMNILYHQCKFSICKTQLLNRIKLPAQITQSFIVMSDVDSSSNFCLKDTGHYW